MELTIWDKMTLYYDALKARDALKALSEGERDDLSVVGDILANMGKGRTASMWRAYGHANYHDNLAHGWASTRQRQIALKWEAWGDVLAGKKPCPAPRKEITRDPFEGDW